MSCVTHVSGRIRESENKKRSVVGGAGGPQLQLPNDAQRLPNYSDYCCIYVFSSADSDALLNNLLSTFAEIPQIGNYK